jgi:hypothetical protein
MVDDANSAFGLQAVGVTAIIVVPILYFFFLATLDTPLSRPFRSPVVQGALLLAAAVLETYWFTNTGLFIGGFNRETPIAHFESRSGPLSFTYNLLSLGVTIFALVVAVWAFRSARTEAVRRRAKAFAIAFGIRDMLRILAIISVLAFPSTTGGVGDLRFILFVPMLTLVYVPLLAYGILRTQLFDVDLKIRWTVKQSTVAAFFIAAFFLVSEAAQTFFQQSGFGPYLGILAAAMLVFAIAPIQRVAEGVAKAAMPSVSNTPTYVAYKKLEVYRAALEGAAEDGEVTSKEHAVLARLREKLGISTEDAAALESEVLASIPYRGAAGTA